MIWSDLITFQSWIKCADSTVPLIGRKGTVTYTRKLNCFAFEVQCTIYLI